MTRRLDPRVDGLDLTQLRDAVVTAEGALRHADQHLRARVEDVQALDGMVVTVWTTLLGTREERLETGLARVQQARQQVVSATERRDVARAELAAAEHDRRVAEEREAERIVTLEACADAVRGTRHPVAKELAVIEDDLGTLRAQIAALDEVMAASGAVLGAASAAASRGASWRKACSAQSRRLEEALAGVGVEWTASRFAEGRLTAVRTEEGPRSATLMQLRELELLREELRLVLEPVLALRKTATEAVDTAQDQRDRLLEGIS